MTQHLKKTGVLIGKIQPRSADKKKKKKDVASSTNSNKRISVQRVYSLIGGHGRLHPSFDATLSLDTRLGTEVCIYTGGQGRLAPSFLI